MVFYEVWPSMVYPGFVSHGFAKGDFHSTVADAEQIPGPKGFYRDLSLCTD